MPRLTRDFTPAEPGQVDYYEVDFAGNLPTGWSLSDAQWQLAVDSVLPGAARDQNPGSRLDGAANVSETLSTQKIGPLIAGNTYLASIAGVITDASDPPNTGTVLLWGLLPCRAPGQATVDLVDLADRLAELRIARDSGALQVRHGDETTTYRSLVEMNAIIAGLEAQLAAGPPAAEPQRTNRVRLVATKGLDSPWPRW